MTVNGLARSRGWQWIACFAALLLVTPSVLPAQQAPETRAVETMPRNGLPNFFAKLRDGKDVRIAYLGGSITAADGWRASSLKWFADHYPKAHLSEVDASLSGTGSVLGAFRVDHDALRFHPDLLFVEFAVNDHGTSVDQIKEAMEGIVRKTWRQDPHTDICFIYTLNKEDLPKLEDGTASYTSAAMEQVASFYGIPSINLGVSVAALAKTGKLIFQGPPPPASTVNAASEPTSSHPMIFSSDGTHPYTDTGHVLYLRAIARSVPLLESAPAGAPRFLTTPLDLLNLEHATVLPVESVHREGDWKPASPEDSSGQMQRSLPAVWVAEKPGDALFFSFDGTLCGLFGVKGPDAGQFSVTIDGAGPIVTTLFDPYSTAGRYRIRPWFSATLPPGHHKVSIQLIGKFADKEAVLKRLNQSTTSSPEFDRAVLYIGNVLINGVLTH